MNKTETEKIVLHIADVSPFFKYPTGDPKTDVRMIKSWHLYLQDYSFKTVHVIVVDLVGSIKGRTVGVSDIIDRIKEVAKPEEERLTPEEHWDRIVRIAVDTNKKPYLDDGRDGKLKEDSDILRNEPEEVKRAVASIGGLKIIRHSKVGDSWIRKAFLDSYNNIGERIDHEPLPELSSSIQDEIKQLGEGMKKIGG